LESALTAERERDWSEEISRHEVEKCSHNGQKMLMNTERERERERERESAEKQGSQNKSLKCS